MNEKELFDILKKVQDNVLKYVDSTKGLPFELFLSSVAMIVEERCFLDGVDVVETMRTLAVVAEGVNAAEGKYNPN